MAHGAGPTSNGNRVSAGRYWRVRSTNTPYVPPRICGGRVLLTGTRGGAEVKRDPGLCGALVVCPLNQHTLRPAADVWGAGITDWHKGRGRRQTGTGSVARWWCVRSTNTPYVPPRMCGGQVLLSGTRGGADVKREPGLCRALLACPLNQHTLRSTADLCGGRVLLSGTRGGADIKREPGLCRAMVACPLNQHTLRPAADVWGAGIPEWHTGRGRRQTGTGSVPGAIGVSAQPTHPTSRRGSVGGGY